MLCADSAPDCGVQTYVAIVGGEEIPCEGAQLFCTAFILGEGIGRQDV